MLNEVALAEEYLGKLRPVTLEVNRSAAAIAAIPVSVRRFIIVPLIQQPNKNMDPNLFAFFYLL